MRNRLIEITAALVGVVAVVALYSDRSWFGGSDAASEAPVTMPEESTEVIAAPSEVVREVAPDRPAPAVETEAQPVAGQTAVDEVVLMEATQEWEAARESLKAVEAQLNQLDTVFDAREAEFAELEAQGTDPEMLEEEMLIFLDGVVTQYDELETRLAEAEDAERAASERLITLRGDLPDRADPDGGN